MKKKIALLVLILFVAIGSFITTKIIAERRAGNLHFKLPLNQNMTESSNQMKLNTVGFERHIGRKAKEKIPASFLEANLSLSDIGNPTEQIVNGHGVVKIEHDTFPFTITNQPISLYQLPDQTIVYTGGLSGTMRTKSGDSIFVLGIDYDPQKDQTFMSTFIGELNEESGLGVLRFGEPILTKEMSDTIEATREAERNKNNEVNRR